MKKYFLFICICFLRFNSYGQDSDYSICDCCTQLLFQYKDDYVLTFPPNDIKSNRIKELTIYTTSKQNQNPKDTIFKVVDKEYKEMIFKFNADGYVTTQTIFNRRGHFHSIYEFTRDNTNNILTKNFYYLDESGNKMQDFIPEKWIYIYSNNQLVKVKKLGDKFIENPDNKSDYIIYKYDQKGRVVSETRQLYYDWTESSFYETKTKYNDTANTYISTTKDKVKLFSTLKVKLTKSQKPLIEKYIDGRNNKLLREEVFTYNSNEQLTKYEIKSSGMGSECPDRGSFTNTFAYLDNKLISKILHQYKKTICELRFEYK